jgi:hypothetical protein
MRFVPTVGCESFTRDPEDESHSSLRWDVNHASGIRRTNAIRPYGGGGAQSRNHNRIPSAIGE